MKKYTKEQFHVDQVAWLSSARGLMLVTVMKVGRKLIQFDGWTRFNLETQQMEEKIEKSWNPSTKQLYLTQEAYYAAQAVCKNVRWIKENLDRCSPELVGHIIELMKGELK